jgi:hypothetical protein
MSDESVRVSNDDIRVKAVLRVDDAETKELIDAIADAVADKLRYRLDNIRSILDSLQEKESLYDLGRGLGKGFRDI